MKPSNEIMAMKSMDKRSTVMKNQVQHVHSEKNVLAESNSGWIVQLHASFQDKHMLHLLMDFMPGGDLMELLIKYDIFTESATKTYISELVVALKHVHSLGYIHRDIKPGVWSPQFSLSLPALPFVWGGRGWRPLLNALPCYIYICIYIYICRQLTDRRKRSSQAYGLRTL